MGTIMDPYSSLYEFLKVRSDVSNDELKRRKKELLVMYHPDKVQDVHIKKLCEDHCKSIMKAYDDIMALRKHKHENTNWSKGDHYDMLYSMLDSSHDDLYDKTYIGEHVDTMGSVKVFEELEAQMKRM